MAAQTPPTQIFVGYHPKKGGYPDSYNRLFGNLLMKIVGISVCVLLAVTVAVIYLGISEMERKGKYIELTLENDSSSEITKVTVVADNITKHELSQILPHTQNVRRIPVSSSDNHLIKVNTVYPDGSHENAVQFNAWGGSGYLIILSPNRNLIVQKWGSS